MRYVDWGVRSSQWAGLRSVSTSVCGVPVHYVRAESARTNGGDVPDRQAPVQLLVPPMTGSASMWLDLVPRLQRFGPVISLDLPGTVAGHTGSVYPRGPRAELDARFVAAVVRRLGIDGQVVLHGWSTGGLVAALAAGMMPDAVRGVVLIAPALPWRRTAPGEAFWWRTVGRLAVAAGPPAARVVLRLAGRRLLDAKRHAMRQSRGGLGGQAGTVGGDPGRVSSAQVDLWTADLDTVALHPQRLAGTSSAFASVVKAMFITQQATNTALDAVRAPVLVLWGDDDPLVDATSLLQHAHRPGWTACPLDGVGHLLPVEAPDRCAHEIGRWLTEVSS